MRQAGRSPGPDIDTGVSGVPRRAKIAFTIPTLRRAAAEHAESEVALGRWALHGVQQLTRSRAAVWMLQELLYLCEERS
jgi:hypothetical protein